MCIRDREKEACQGQINGSWTKKRVKGKEMGHRERSVSRTKKCVKEKEECQGHMNVSKRKERVKDKEMCHRERSVSKTKKGVTEKETY